MTTNSKVSVGLSILAVIGVGVTAVISAKRQDKLHKMKISRCTDLWDEMTEEEFQEKKDEPFESVLDKKEKAKLIFKCHWPTMIAGTATVACIVGAQVLDIREILGLSAGLAAITYKYDDMKRYLQEKYPEQFKDVQNYVNRQAGRRAIEDEKPHKEETYDGRKRYYFPLSDQLVYMKPEDLVKVQGFISASMGTEMQVTLNEILDFIHYNLGYKDVHISDKDYIWEFDGDEVVDYDSFPQIELDYDDILDDNTLVTCQVVQLSIMGDILLPKDPEMGSDMLSTIKKNSVDTLSFGFN